jgi:dynamin-binding protein
MDVTASDGAEPIFELSVQCERLFTEQIKELTAKSRMNDAAILSELSQRFAAWAAFLGVFAESKVCLDRRLRRHVEIREQVLRLLDIMERNLTFCIISSLGHSA